MILRAVVVLVQLVQCVEGLVVICCGCRAKLLRAKGCSERTCCKRKGGVSLTSTRRGLCFPLILPKVQLFTVRSLLGHDASYFIRVVDALTFQIRTIAHTAVQSDVYTSDFFQYIFTMSCWSPIQSRRGNEKATPTEKQKMSGTIIGNLPYYFILRIYLSGIKIIYVTFV